MRIAILGAVCFDEIFPLEGERREGFGGILYNTAAFSSILGEHDTVRPVSKIGADRYDAVLAEFARLDHVDTSALTRCAGPVTHVTLTWRSVSWRDEVVRHRMPPYSDNDLSPALECDAVHINFINGTEIGLGTLRRFRKRYSGRISLDVHNIISHFDAEGRRTIVGFPQWRDWAPCIDVLQCNEFEIATMLEGPFNERKDYIEAAKTVCAAGPQAVSITLGPEGAVTVHRKNDRFFAVDIAVLPPIKAVDTTGCGDSFSAGFMVGMLRYGDPATALACATVVAGVNARKRGLGRLDEAIPLMTNPRAHFAVYEGRLLDWPGEPV